MVGIRPKCMCSLYRSFFVVWQVVVYCGNGSSAIKVEKLSAAVVDVIVAVCCLASFIAVTIVAVPIAVSLLMQPPPEDNQHNKIKQTTTSKNSIGHEKKTWHHCKFSTKQTTVV